MNYGGILRRALDITWRHRVLWIFGVAAVLFAGSAAPGNGGQGVRYALDSADLDRWGLAGPGSINWEAVVPIIVALVGIALVVGLVLFIVGLVVRYTSYGALIAGVDEVERTEETTFRSALSAGWPRFLRLLAMDVLIGIVGLILGAVVALIFLIGLVIVIVPALAIAGRGDTSIWIGIIWGVLTGIAWLVLLILVALVFSALFTLWREFAYRATVLDGRGVFDALGDGYTLMRTRLGQAGIMWLILTGIGLVLNTIAVPLVVVAGGVIALIIGLAYGATQSVAPVLIIGIPVTLVAVLVAVFVAGVYYTFTSSVWTLTYRELRPAPSAVQPATV